MIGKVTHVVGLAELLDTRGQSHTLVAGDWLRAGDRLVTHVGTTLAVETVTGEQMQVAEAQTLTLTAQWTADYAANASDDAINPQVLQHLLTMLQSEEGMPDSLGLSALTRANEIAESFVAFAFEREQQTESSPSTLHIADLISDHVPAAPATHLGAAEMGNLLSNAGLPSEVAMQQNLLKDWVKD